MLARKFQLLRVKTVLILLFLAVVFSVKIPWERSLNREFQALDFAGSGTLLNTREKLNQYMFVAVMGGFRNVVANLLWISAHADWQNYLWERQKEKYRVVLTLQPRSVYFWENAGWHFAWNSSYAAKVDPNERREVVRLRNEKRWIDLGRSTLGRLLADKQGKPLEAAEEFHQASQLPEAPIYLKRQVAYKCYEGGDFARAYEIMSRLWRESEEHRLPTLQKRIPELEQKLGIPPEKRIFPSVR